MLPMSPPIAVEASPPNNTNLIKYGRVAIVTTSSFPPYKTDGSASIPQAMNMPPISEIEESSIDLTIFLKYAPAMTLSKNTIIMKWIKLILQIKLII